MKKDLIVATEHKTLLNLTRLLYKAYEGGRPKPFNLFSVLRSSHDEVNLHSRFLAALLDHREHGTKGRENLKDFVRTVLNLKIDGRFDWTESRVQRESSNIDILVTWGSQVAIVIENKIYARDQDRQLDGYLKTVKEMGFEEIHLVYLTLHGSPPSEESLGSLRACDERLKCRGYDSENVFQAWLRNCLQRAFDEPELRGSIVQYLQLVQELTGHKGGYMTALEKLLKQEDNLLRASELAEAMVRRMIDLQKDLWNKIIHEAESQTGLRFELDPDIEDIEKEIGRYYTPSARNKTIQYSARAKTKGLRADLELSLTVQLYANRLQWGVSYGEKQEDQRKHQKLIDGFRTRFHCRSDSWWPCVESDDERFTLQTNKVPPFSCGSETASGMRTRDRREIERHAPVPQ